MNGRNFSGCFLYTYGFLVFLFSKAGCLGSLTICPSFYNSSIVSQWQSLTVPVTFVRIRLVCSEVDLPEQTPPFTWDTAGGISVCTANQSLCSHSYSESPLCTICATEPPEIRTHFRIRRMSNENVDIAFNEWLLELVEPLQLQCVGESSINISIRCASASRG